LILLFDERVPLNDKIHRRDILITWLSFSVKPIVMDLSQSTFRHIYGMLMKNLPYSTTQPPSLLRKVVASIVTLSVFGLALMFSVLLFAVILAVGATAFVYLWWRTRDLRKQMRMHPPGGAEIRGEAYKGEVYEGEVIEGEVISEIDRDDAKGGDH
jgi:hypothetical protein